MKVENKCYRISQIGFCTLQGHLIDGEERFRVKMDEENGDCYYVMYSFTKGSGILGKIAMPLIRPLQKSFFKDQATAIKDMFK
jgi:uncharacterized protein (UPF0548 family)